MQSRRTNLVRSQPELPVGIVPEAEDRSIGAYADGVHCPTCHLGKRPCGLDEISSPKRVDLGNSFAREVPTNKAGHLAANFVTKPQSALWRDEKARIQKCNRPFPPAPNVYKEPLAVTTAV